MKSAKNILSIASKIVIVITVLSAVFSYIAMTSYFDHDIGHYKSDSIITALAMYLPFTVTVLSIVCIIITRKKAQFTDKPPVSIPTVFSSVLTGMLLAATSSLSMLSLVPLSRLSLAAVITGLISALYFATSPFAGNRPFMTYLSFIPPVWAAMTLLEEYFKSDGPINSPIRTASLTMFALLLLFFAEEIRFDVGIQSTGIYYFCLFNAIAFTGNAVLPKLAVIITGKNTSFRFSAIECFLGVAIFLLLLSKLIASVSVIKDIAEAEPTQEAVTPEISEAPESADNT